jgi:hypothetical protein
MQQETDKINNAISQMMDAASNTAHTQDEMMEIIVNLYLLALLIGKEQISLLVECSDFNKMNKLIRHKISEAQYLDLDIDNILNESVNNLPTTLRMQFLQLIMEVSLPSIAVAKSIYEHSRNLHSLGIIGHPAELSNLIIQLIGDNKDKRPGERILCIGDSALPEVIDSLEANEVTYQVSRKIGHQDLTNKLVFIAGKNIELRKPESLNLDLSGSKFTGAVIADPWNVKYFTNRTVQVGVRYGNVSSHVENIEACLNQVNGRIVTVLPISWLFKTHGEDNALKKMLIEKGLIEAVIQLPQRTFSVTSVMPALLVINTTEKHDSIRFINAADEYFYKDISRSQRQLVNTDKVVELLTINDDQFMTKASLSEVIENDCNLNVKRYVKSNDQLALENSLNAYEEQVSLGDVAEIIGCQAIKVTDDEGDTVTELGPININTTGAVVHNSQFKQYVPDTGLDKRVAAQTLRANDIVFTIKGSLGKCALVTEDEAGMIASQSFCIIRLKSGSDIKSPQILLRYLLSDLGKLMIENLSSGATVKMLKMKDLQSLIVPVPSIEQQSEIEQNYQDVLGFTEQIKSLEEQIGQKMKQYWSV